MSDTNTETIADIIAEKRRRADEIERDVAEKMKRGEMTSDQYARELVADIRKEADRLEAAYKRERGDCAKLREALRLVSRVAVQMTRGTITGEAPTRKEVDDWAMRLCDIIDAALAATAKEGVAK